MSRKLSIMIDPGHGGLDPGAVYGDLHEADLNRIYAVMLLAELVSMGHRPLLSRRLNLSQSAYCPLSARVSAANQNKVDAFISLHTNAFTRSDARGIRFFTADSGNPKDRLCDTLAVAIATQTNFMVGDRIPVSLGPRRKRFTVLMKTSMPAVLIETGFITSRLDRGLITDVNFIAETTQAYARGIDLWADTLERIKK
jgi:N-acetylmuramoyl-L-alanine amidase